MWTVVQEHREEKEMFYEVAEAKGNPQYRWYLS